MALAGSGWKSAPLFCPCSGPVKKDAFHGPMKKDIFHGPVKKDIFHGPVKNVLFHRPVEKHINAAPGCRPV